MKARNNGSKFALSQTQDYTNIFCSSCLPRGPKQVCIFSFAIVFVLHDHIRTTYHSTRRLTSP
jgi:hypothetical protein